jgi:hypothetical protein
MGTALVFIGRMLLETVGDLRCMLETAATFPRWCSPLGEGGEGGGRETFPKRLFQSVWLINVSIGTRRTCQKQSGWPERHRQSPARHPQANSATQPKQWGQTSRLLPLSLRVTSSRSDTPTLRPSDVKRVSISGIEVAPSRAKDTTCRV